MVTASHKRVTELFCSFDLGGDISNTIPETPFPTEDTAKHIMAVDVTRCSSPAWQAYVLVHLRSFE